MKSTRLILVLLLSAVMVEHIYGKSYEDEADYFDLDDYEENSDDYLDFEPEDIEEERPKKGSKAEKENFCIRYCRRHTTIVNCFESCMNPSIKPITYNSGSAWIEEYKGKRRNNSVKEAVPVKEAIPVKISIFDRMNNMRICDLQCPCKSQFCWAESSKRLKCIDDCLSSLSKSNKDIEEEVSPSATLSNKKVSNKVASAAVTNTAKNSLFAFNGQIPIVAKKMKLCEIDKTKCKRIPDECDLICEGKIQEKACSDCVRLWWSNKMKN